MNCPCVRRHSFCLIALWLASVALPGVAQTPNLVVNGSFEDDANADGIPDGWVTAGRAEIQQHVTRDAGRDGGTSGRLECATFVPGTPDSHAMVCQLGKVSVERGQWYRLSFWAKGRDMARSICQVALSNTEPWGSSGVGASFGVSPSWQRIERLCQATATVPAETSRLQFWFGSTGVLWLDDVSLEPVDVSTQYHPQIATEGVRNLVPNSSFECGTAGWGSYGPGLRTWTGNVFRLVGDIDASTASHGDGSLRIRLPNLQDPTYYFDWFDVIEQPLRAVAAAHIGWIPLTPGKPCTLSCSLKADAPETPALLMLHESSGADRRKSVTVGTDWQRFSFTVTPSSEFGWAAVGLDLQDSELDAATLWLDAVQFEFGDTASPYTPRSPVESFITTPRTGNVFTDPEAGLTADVHACTTAAAPRTVRGRVIVRDFLDEEVAAAPVELSLDAGDSRSFRIANLLPGRRGFYRVHWQPEDRTQPFPQSLRCALIDPYEHADSPFGMNHAFGWSFLLRLCKTAGLTWMRDWSVKWLAVEPEPGAFDFSTTDPQIDRVLADDLNLLMLFPFPSAPWSSAGDLDVIREVIGDQRYRNPQYISACPPEDEALLDNYVARSVQNYRDRVDYYEVFNEPLYTTYAVPARFGYEMDDYVRLLRVSHEAIKANQPDAQVLGGIGTWPSSSWVQEFVEAGGLDWCDIMDIHLYPVTIPPELYEDDLVQINKAMEARGQVKPMWLTEFGCYADDDLYKTPGQIGDSAMSRSNWPSERDAAEALVKSSAVFLTRGVKKTFFHSGTCGPINGRDGNGIFFEYGGAPRKMYVALSALANVLGPAPAPLLPPIATERLRAYLFRTNQGVLAVAWAADEPIALQPSTGVVAKDIMGNAIEAGDLSITRTPTYLVAEDAGVLRQLLGRAQ